MNAQPGRHATKTSYAGAASQHLQSHGHQVQPGGGQHLGVPHVPSRGWARPPRSRSPSVKIFRNDDGSATEIIQTAQTASKKGVVGTSNPEINGRKMKSPPAAIFVWGVHPETEKTELAVLTTIYSR